MRYWWKGYQWKTSWPRKSFRRKTDTLWLRLEGLEGQVRHKTWKSKSRSFDEGRLEVTCSHVQSCTVMCSHVQCGWECQVWDYPNSSKNTIKFKRSLVLLRSFVNVIGWLSSLSFGRPNRLDYWSSHWWCDVNSKRSRDRLVRMVFVERVDELYKMLDSWSWLPGILFLWISFLRDQIVETW